MKNGECQTLRLTWIFHEITHFVMEWVHELPNDERLRRHVQSLIIAVDLHGVLQLSNEKNALCLYLAF